jgi:hypothetical protein
MNTKHSTPRMSAVEKFLTQTRLFNLNNSRSIDSLRNLSYIIGIFALIFIPAYIYKWINVQDFQFFKLVFTDTNILPLYQSSPIGFICISVYEILKLAIAAYLMVQLAKFFGSLDKENPFKNIASKQYLLSVAFLSIAFFVVDTIGSIHLYYLQDILNKASAMRLFHFEYLFIAYFMNVFAQIFKRGVDLNNEIDLVI